MSGPDIPHCDSARSSTPDDTQNGNIPDRSSVTSDEDDHLSSNNKLTAGESSCIKVNTNMNAKSDEEFEMHHSLPHPSEIKKGSNAGIMQTIAGVAGNVLEWYDFAVFGYFSDIIADVFFPKQAGHAALVESFAIFGGAFLVRPFGGLMMGYIGDTYGRKRALEISIFLMAFPTFAMGCLPTYEQVGWLAIVLLALVRILQGLSVGGQLMTSLVFTLESHERSKWGLYGSFVMMAANFGSLLGSVVGFVMRRVLSDEDLRSWGWRIPFLCGILVGVSGFYLKYHCEEISHIPQMDGKERVNPIIAAFSPANRRALLSSCLVPMLWSAAVYLTFVWMAIFMTDLIEDPIPEAFAINALSLFLSIVLLFPVVGMMSDKYGRKPIMMVGGVGLAILAPFMVYAISLGRAFLAFAAQITLGVFVTMWGAPMCAWLVESFPPEVRLTAVSIGYNIAQATVGGFSPSLATWLADHYGVSSPGFIYSVVAIVAIIGLWKAPELQAPEPQAGNFLAIETNNSIETNHDANMFTIGDDEDEDDCVTKSSIEIT